MSLGVDHLAGVILGLRRDLAAAIGPAEVVDRVLSHLEGPVGAAGVSVHAGGEELARSTAAPAPLPGGEDPDGGGPEGVRLVLDLDGFGADPAVLVVARSGSTPFAPTEVALLEAVAALVSGALERARLFAEVMELERLKNDFIARVSHELRTPLTIITGFLDTLLTHGEHLDPEQRLHMLDRSRSASARLARLIEELLVLSRMEAGVLTPEVARVDVAELLGEVRDASIEPGQVVVVAPAGAELRTDPTLLVRALGLLVDNAVKYGGTATMTAEPRDEGWSIEVRDRGPGFDPDVRATAFEMFTRGPRTGAVPGLGVGLAIARTIVEVLDGTLAIDEPADGPGAVLRVVLP